MVDREKVNGHWEIDPDHTRIGFSARHAMITSVRGSFNDITGKLLVDIDNPGNSSAVVTLNVASVDTRNAKRDEHLRSEDFFNVEKWPTITFVSTSIEEVDENAIAVIGDLTIRDVTRQIMIPLAITGVQEDAWGVLRAGFEGTRRLERRDYGLEWNMPLDTGGVLISERITLEFEISAIKSDDSEAKSAD
ncbi:YceI family protein [Microbacterium sp. GXF6406]